MLVVINFTMAMMCANSNNEPHVHVKWRQSPDGFPISYSRSTAKRDEESKTHYGIHMHQILTLWASKISRLGTTQQLLALFTSTINEVTSSGSCRPNAFKYVETIIYA